MQNTVSFVKDDRVKEKRAKIFDIACEYSLYGLMFFIPISSAAIESFFGFVALSFILKKIIKPDFNFLKSLPNLFLLLFVIFMGLSFVNSGAYIGKSFKALFFKWLEYIAIFLIMQDVLATRVRQRNALGIMLFVAFLVGVDGFTQKLWNVEFFRHRPMVRASSGLYFISGPFQHYNDLATYLLVFSLITFGLLMSGTFVKKTKSFLILLLVLLGTCLLLTSSRGAWLGFLSALTLMFILSKRFVTLYAVIGAFLVVLLFLPGIKERMHFTFGAGGDATRFAMWQGALAMIEENPYLGKGLGTFMDHFPRYNYTENPYARYAHNCFLQIWAESGGFSLLSFLLFIGIILWWGIEVFKKKKDYLSLGIICAIFGFLAHSFVDTQLYSLQLAMLFWVMLGFLTARVTLLR